MSHEFEGNERFEILTRLGEGGMGSVYQAVDRSRDVRIALKSVGRVSGDSLLRFKREYRALQEIRHPNLVELGELFEMDQSWFITMELIDGVDFCSYVRDPASGPLLTTATVSMVDGLSLQGHPLAPGSAGFSEARLRRGLAGLVSGVAALHAHGLVHRDLKPANVLVADDGRVVLIDFGLVTGSDHIAQSTEMHLVGTAAYMSPEQAAQEPIGPAADWYALGVILYECLTGRLPIDDDSQIRVLMRKQHEVPPAPQQLVPDVPADLDALCMELLAIDQRKRPTVQEIYRRLHVEAQLPDKRPSTSLSVLGLPDTFVGRSGELGRLSRAFARTLRGEQHTVNLMGPSGVGKSALLRRFQADLLAADADTLVLHGQCHEHETVPYKALDGIMDALSKWLKTVPPELVKPLLPSDIQLIATTFTVLERIPAVRSAAARSKRSVKDPQEKRLRLISGVRELFRRIAQQWRTVVILEDMQWSDEDSYHMVHELIRAPDAPPLLIVFSRQPGLNVPLGDRVRFDPEAHEEIVLSPLERAESLELSQRIRPGHPESVLRRIVDQAEGYPFLLQALVHASSGSREADVPNAEDVLEGLFKGLTAPSRALLEVISLAGFPISKRLAAEAAGVPAEDLSSELKFLRAARWVRTGGPLVTDLIEPSHDRVRQTVLGQLDMRRRTSLHGSIALALEETRAESDRIAHHYLLAGDRRKAALNLHNAAERALAALAFDHAAALFGQLIELDVHEPDERRELFIARGDALASGGRGLDAAQAYLGAVPHATGTLALDLQRRVAEQYLISGRYEEGMKACSAFLEGFGIALPATPRGALLELVLLRTRLFLGGKSFKTRQPEQLSQEELARIDALWSMSKGLASHDLIRTQVFQTRGLLRALSAGEPYRVSRALSLEFVNVLVQNPRRRQDAELLLARAMELAKELGSAHAVGLAHVCRGLGEYAGPCRFAEALDAVEQGLVILRNECQNVAWEVSQGIQIASNARMVMGHWRALRESRRACQEAKARGDLFLGLSMRGVVLSFLSLLDDHPEAAADEVEHAFALLEGAPSPLERFTYEIATLRVLQYCGRADDALTKTAHRDKGLAHTLLRSAPIVRLLSTEMALHNVLLAAELAQDRKARLNQAASIVNKLERVGIGCALPSGHLGRAAIAHAHGQMEQALSSLERAEAGFVEHQRDADAAAARRRRGQLLGGDQGKALLLSAERWFAGQGVRNIPAMCRLLAPGFAGLS